MQCSNDTCALCCSLRCNQCVMTNPRPLPLSITPSSSSSTSLKVSGSVFGHPYSCGMPAAFILSNPKPKEPLAFASTTRCVELNAPNASAGAAGLQSPECMPRHTCQYYNIIMDRKRYYNTPEYERIRLSLVKQVERGRVRLPIGRVCGREELHMAG